jgi:hypothetical protein
MTSADLPPHLGKQSSGVCHRPPLSDAIVTQLVTQTVMRHLVEHGVLLVSDGQP